MQISKPKKNTQKVVKWDQKHLKVSGTPFFAPMWAFGDHGGAGWDDKMAFSPKILKSKIRKIQIWNLNLGYKRPYLGL